MTKVIFKLFFVSSFLFGCATQKKLLEKLDKAHTESDKAHDKYMLAYREAKRRETESAKTAGSVAGIESILIGIKEGYKDAIYKHYSLAEAEAKYKKAIILDYKAHAEMKKAKAEKKKALKKLRKAYFNYEKSL